MFKIWLWKSPENKLLENNKSLFIVDRYYCKLNFSLLFKFILSFKFLPFWLKIILIKYLIRNCIFYQLLIV
jgi:hypothetical protein